MNSAPNPPAGSDDRTAASRSTVANRVAVNREGGTVTVTLTYPAKLNVLDRDGWIRLGDVFRELAADPSVRCVLLRGDGVKAFSAGSDIGTFAEQRDTPAQVEDYAQALRHGIEGVYDCPHPTVAVIRGLCVGGGLILAACCDLRVCGESSRFGAPVNRLGLTMAYEEVAPLVAAARGGAVLEVLLTGDLVSAERAREMGLINRVTADGTVGEAAAELARRISAGAPLVNRWHKKFVRRLTAVLPPEGESGAGPLPLGAAERAEAYEAFQTDDYREGRAAFVEKRTPRFKGE